MLRRPRATRVVKLNSERRRAKRSPSFVLGGVPRILPLALFCGRAVVISREVNPGIRPWQDLREMRSRATGGGNISPRCVPWRLAVAISRFMHPRRGPGREKRPSLATYCRRVSKTSWHWQDSRAMYPKSAANRLSGMHSAKILPGRAPFRCTDPSNHTWGANLAGEPPLHWPLESCIPRRSCHPSPPNSASDRKHGAALMARQPA